MGAHSYSESCTTKYKKKYPHTANPKLLKETLNSR